MNLIVEIVIVTTLVVAFDVDITVKQVHALLQKDSLVDRASFEGANAGIKYQYVVLSVLV